MCGKKICGVKSVRVQLSPAEQRYISIIMSELGLAHASEAIRVSLKKCADEIVQKRRRKGELERGQICQQPGEGGGE
ncbi:MAG: hypothetical protein QW692_03825 [Nitrososphaerota archaeon]